ncbi:translation elongation factor Ts [Peptococcaceae bacterium]|nr:translation elongation factor Ts [Peptococcaceae bacterium]
MFNIPAKLVKELRERTGAGMMDCKKALAEAGGDIDKAVNLLREKGLAAAAKKAGRVAAEGVVSSYIHGDGRIGVLVEVNCETDFVAKTDEFKELVKDIAMQIAAAKPEYVRREDVPESVIEKEIEKHYKEICLLDQPFIKNPDITVQQLVNEKIAKIGENIVVRRFVRFELGEGIEKKDDFVDEVMSQVKK